eukprot:1769071-Prymnesium_polylepis.2
MMPSVDPQTGQIRGSAGRLPYMASQLASTSREHILSHRTRTLRPWEPVGTGFGAAGTPLQHPSILPWHRASSPAGS